MEKSLKELRVVHSSSLIIIIEEDDVRIYGDDAKIIENISNFVSENNLLVFKYKNLDNIINLLKKKRINFVVLDKDLEYKVHNYYYNENNSYEYYLKKSKKYSKFRKMFISFYNLIFGLPYNRFK